MDDLDLLAVEVNRERTVKGDDRERFFGPGLEDALAAFDGLGEALSHIGVRDDRSQPAEDVVASGVVPVPVGVQDELEAPFVEILEGGLYPFGQRGELIVDHQQAVRAHRDADVAARPGEHVNAPSDVDGLDLDLREIPCGQGRYRQS